ncbi:MAG: very short patch repair endonuclease, partial [Gemmatimonadetes bacterium]|nr:very short patch repair endonuclease [Gemmatimonadota bacterium]
MTDILSPEERSERMSRVKGGDTKPEVVFRKALWREGLRYRL